MEGPGPPPPQQNSSAEPAAAPAPVAVEGAAAAAVPVAAVPAAVAAAAAPVGAAEEQGSQPKKKHHLLRHELTTEVQHAALAVFNCTTQEDAAHAVWKLKQRELQDAFAKVYGQRTSSCNNEWMRGKLLQALGMDARWRPPSMQPPPPPPPPAVEPEPPADPNEVSRYGRRRRAAALAALQLTRDVHSGDEGSPSPVQRRASKPAAARGGANSNSGNGGVKRQRQSQEASGSGGSRGAAGASHFPGAAAPPHLAVSAEAATARNADAAANTGLGGGFTGVDASSSRQPGQTWPRQQPPPQQQQQQEVDGGAAHSSRWPAANSAPYSLDGPGLAAADAALALAAGQQLPLTQQQQQQLLLLEKQHQEQQQRLHQQFLLQQRLLLAQQELQAQAQAPREPLLPGSTQPDAAAKQRQTPPPGSQQVQAEREEEQSWAPLAAAPTGSVGLLPITASQPSLRPPPLGLASALSAAAGLTNVGGSQLQQALPSLGNLSWQLLSAAQQRLDDRHAGADLRKSVYLPPEAAAADLATEALLANDMRRMQGLPPAVMLPGLWGRPAMPQAAATAAATAAVAAAAAGPLTSSRGAACAPPMPFNPFAVAAAAAAAAAAEQQQQAPAQEIPSLPPLGSLPPLASLPPLGIGAAMLSGPVPLPALGVNGTLSTELHSLYSAWQDGNVLLDP